MDEPAPAGRRGREEEREAVINRFPMHRLPRDLYHVFLATLEDPLDVWALYKYAMVPAPTKGARSGQPILPTLREWADAADAWTYLLRERFRLPEALLARYSGSPESRWLYFAYAFALQRPRRTYRLWWPPAHPDVVGPWREIERSVDVTTTLAGGNVEMRSGRQPNELLTRVHMRWRAVCSELMMELGGTARLFLHGQDLLRMTTYVTADDGDLLSVFGVDNGDAFDVKAIDCAYTGMLYAALEAGYELREWRGSQEERIRATPCVTCAAPLTDRLCGGCERVAYCSEKCAAQHWESGGHRGECNAE